MTKYLHCDEPTSASSLPVMLLDPSTPIKMKKSITGLGDKLTVLQLGQHLLKYDVSWYELVTSTICPDEWIQGQYQLRSGLVLTIEGPEERESREQQVQISCGTLAP